MTSQGRSENSDQSGPLHPMLPNADQQTVSINMASCGESSKTFVSSAINTVSLTEYDIPGARLPREVPKECIVTQLKRWLSCRGARTIGKKQQLITRLVSFQQDFEICLLQVKDLQFHVLIAIL